MGRWTAAENRLLAGHRLAPRDERFPIELGGLAFKQKRLAEATAWLRRAVRANRRHAYANDFLATLYFLQGNLEAALKYWNRSGKPAIAELEIEPALRTDAVLLDRAFTFAAGDTLLLRDLRTTEARVAGLGVFSTHSLRLDGRADGKFDLRFTARERSGWGDSQWHALLRTLRGIPYQAVHPEYFNVSGRAVNLESMVRWDPRKRRVRTALSSPLRGDPRYRVTIEAGGRDEQWELRSLSASLGSLRLRRTAASAGISSFESGGWSWSSAVELSHRDYWDISGAAVAETSLNQAGYQLKHTLNVARDAWRSPENRIETRVDMSSETAKIWSSRSQLFQRFQVGGAGRWMPEKRGDDYAVHGRIRAGKIFGHAPFDELYMLGLERDNDLWMRGHIGTHHGRKGSAPMGRSYALANWEVDKTVYNDGLLRVKLSPFLDTGRIANDGSPLGSRKWLFDTGVQVKLAVLGVGFTFTYGKDLRSGNNVFYLAAQRSTHID